MMMDARDQYLKRYSGPKGRVASMNIQLDHDIDEHYHYNPGESVSGNVVLTISDGEYVLRALRIAVFGTATVSWKDESEKLFSAEETYVNQSVLLAPLGHGERLHMSPGQHEFMFSYELPEELPSSFIGKFGSVTYIIKSSAEDNRSVMICSEPFLVANMKIAFPECTLRKKVSKEVSKRYWSKYRSGKITAILSLNKQGYSPGDDIDMNAEIHNHSPKIIKGLHAMLIMQSTFSAQNEKHRHVQVISKCHDKWEMTRGEGRRWNDTQLTIPIYAPESKLEGCDIIDIQYEVVLKIEIATKKDKAKELWVNVPIVIIPSSNVVENGVKRRLQNAEARSRTIDRKTLESLDIQKLLDLQSDYEEDGEFGYRRPVDDGTLRINPLFKHSEWDYEKNSTTENTKL